MAWVARWSLRLHCAVFIPFCGSCLNGLGGSLELETLKLRICVLEPNLV